MYSGSQCRLMMTGSPVTRSHVLMLALMRKISIALVYVCLIGALLTRGYCVVQMKEILSLMLSSWTPMHKW